MSFNFFHTLWVYSLCIYLLIYEKKSITNILKGFKIWCQAGEFEFFFLNSNGEICFWKTLLSVWFFKIRFSNKSFENKIPTPQLDIKFWNPYECWWQFFSIYLSIYIHFLNAHKVRRKLKDTFDDRPTRSRHCICPIKLAHRARLKACGAGLRRDIVGA